MRLRATGHTARRALLAGTARALTEPLATCGGAGAAEGDGKPLRLWHHEQEDGALSDARDAAIAAFKKTHPDAEVVFERRTLERIQRNAGMILDSDKAPEVMEYNKGNATTGPLAKQSLLTDLTAIALRGGQSHALKSTPPSVVMP